MGWLLSFDALVSIPNGMEFYQRLRQIRRSKRGEFQFPTGWNSTLAKERGLTIIDAFQFPTGWNSTRLSALGSTVNSCFNSQRDGILQERR